MASPSDLYEMRFEWPHRGPNSVVVTGTFDQWSSSLKLSKTETGFVGTVRVPWAEKIKYKFIIDGRWTCQAGQPTETDPGGFVNNVYITPPKPIVTPQSLDEAIRKANGTTAVVEDAAVPAKDPPSPRARSTSPPPTEARRPYPAPVPEPEPVKLHEVEPTPEGVVLAPELPVDEKKQEAAAAIPIDCTAPEHLASKLEELVVTPEEEKEKIVAPETVPLPETPAAKPEEKKREEAAKPTPSALPTPPATPNPKAGGGLALPNRARSGTRSSERSRRFSRVTRIKKRSSRQSNVRDSLLVG
ncbi:hypothetical protein FA13DRAFT_1339436 [Coprinellus micaceus]|uniref:AMP-activated protein kinase glycogen-binding domain-containing protein n=1 Tax=Coprinellus micaceus TaxID=71717 RepID=A0A4Y7TPE1_COPMI|nr:hypothetical protein FA13DRAFT_1339436 [Coprinellus micaceus]